MLGLFMVLPVLMLYGDQYEGATPALLGLALGIYGLTQACFQIPLGLFSDVVGRKPVIVAGLVIFAVGSLVASMATSIEGLILGRALQGSGAIASAIMAMVADLTSEENRTKAMAAIGASIGLSFSVAMILGPALAAASSLSGVFFLSVILSGIGILIVIFLVPTPKVNAAHRDVATTPALVLKTIRNTHLLRLNWGIFSLHCILMASFVSVPTILEASLGLARDAHWMFYLPVLFLAFVVMLPFMLFAEKKRQIKPVFLAAVGILVASSWLLVFFSSTAVGVVVLVLLFFVAFNLLESMLPSLVSKISPAGTKGTAMGLYSTSQFFGAFVGGAVGGWVMQSYSLTAVFGFSASVAAVWWVVAAFMSPPRHLASVCLKCSDSANVLKVGEIRGVAEVFFSEEEGLMYLKVDRDTLDQEALQQYTRVSGA
ncbi:MAG: MFS transporter [Agarilytica sp.]